MNCSIISAHALNLIVKLYDFAELLLGKVVRSSNLT